MNVMIVGNQVSSPRSSTLTSLLVSNQHSQVLAKIVADLVKDSWSHAIFATIAISERTM